MKIETVAIQTIAGKQAITLPEGLRIDDEKVYLKKVGDVILLIPFSNPWQSLHNSLDSFSSDFMDGREQPPHQTREVFD